MRAFWTTAIICRIRELRRSLCSASGWRKAAKLLDELGEMLELTDDFLGAIARLEDFSPLGRLPRGETQMELIANGIGNKTREGCPQRCTKNCSSGLTRAAASCFSAARVFRRRAAFLISARRTDCIISRSPIRRRKFCPTPFLRAIRRSFTASTARKCSPWTRSRTTRIAFWRSWKPADV